MPLTPALLRRTRATAGCAAALAMASCSYEARPAVRIFAAASLTGPFEVLAQRFRERHPALRVELHCAGTPQLVMQLRQGAPADVFAAANELQMRAVSEAGLTEEAPRAFATNSLALVTAAANPEAITTVDDLGRADVQCLLCAPEVPAGRYARQMLQRAGLEVRSVSDEPSVRAVVSKVELGVVDAGVVYRTDAIAAGDRVCHVPVPPHLNVVATYPIVTTSTGQQVEQGRAFVDFVLSPEGQRILAAHGFSSP